MTAGALAAFAAAHPFQVALDDEGPAPVDDPLLRHYGGPLRVRRGARSLVANFVATADGIAAFGDGRGEGAVAVSLHDAADRFVMALLRSAADCVLIGASTLRDDAHHQWTPRTPLPELADELARHRQRLTGSDAPPLVAVVTASGRLPSDHPALVSPEADVLVITTREGASRLPALHPRVRVASPAATGPIPVEAILEELWQRRSETVLCEGGPRLFGQLAAQGAVDELFLTVSPQLGGRDGAEPRPGLVAGAAFSPAQAPRLALRSLRRSGDHLFIRYAVARRRPGAG